MFWFTSFITKHTCWAANTDGELLFSQVQRLRNYLSFTVVWYCNSVIKLIDKHTLLEMGVSFTNKSRIPNYKQYFIATKLTIPFQSTVLCGSSWIRVPTSYSFYGMKYNGSSYNCMAITDTIANVFMWSLKATALRPLQITSNISDAFIKVGNFILMVINFINE